MDKTHAAPNQGGLRDMSYEAVQPMAEGRTYRYWRLRIMYSMMIGYAVFYIVRANFSFIAPFIKADLGLSQTDIGWIFTIFMGVYGAGKFFNGFLSDRLNARYFMAAGLLLSGVVNLILTSSSSFIFLAIFWGMNGWFQSMGWPPCARMLTHWYSPLELGKRWGIWNCSHQIGSALVAIVQAYLIMTLGWQSLFYLPAIIAIPTSLFLINRLRDTPKSLGLPSIEHYKGLKIDVEEEDRENISMREILLKHILPNKLVWYVSFATFFLYVVRMGFMLCAPTFLMEVKGSSASMAGWKYVAFEVAGMLGGITAGHISDKYFQGRRGAVGTLYMICLTFFLIYFWQIPAGYEFLDMTAMIAVGFFVFGPQVLSGVAAADFSSKKAAGAATGLTGTFGYVGSSVLSGIGVGKIADVWGWNGGFIFFICAAILGALFFALTWRNRSKALG